MRQRSQSSPSRNEKSLKRKDKAFRIPLLALPRNSLLVYRSLRLLSWSFLLAPLNMRMMMMKKCNTYRRTPERVRFFSLLILASIEMSDIGASVFGTTRDLSVHSRPQSLRPPATSERPTFPGLKLLQQALKPPTSSKLPDTLPYNPAATRRSPATRPPTPPPNPPKTLKGKPTNSQIIHLNSDKDEPRSQVPRRPAQEKTRQ